MNLLGNICLAAAVIVSGAIPVAAEERAPVVVELFTSQGCYSCPPADKLLHKMGDHDGIIPLALHVDYWDYIGWEDSFGDAAFSERQRAYAKAAGRRSVYTPQMIINGVDAVVGNRPMDVADLVQEHAQAPRKASVSLRRDGDELLVQAEPRGMTGGAQVLLARYLPLQEVEIRRGENAGKTLVYSHIVTALEVIGQWDGAASFETRVGIEGDAPVVVFLQAPDHGEIYAAARLR